MLFLGTALITALGIGFGLAAGAPGGPMVFVTGILGAFSGATLGAAIGISVAAAVTGITLGGVTAYGLFKRSETETQIEKVSELAKGLTS